MRVQSLQIETALETQRLRIEVDTKQRTPLLDELLGKSRHIADRETDGVEEGALLDPPAKGFRQTFLAFGIERARGTELLDSPQNVQRIAVEFGANLQDGSLAIAASHRRELGAWRPRRNLDGMPAHALEPQGQ